MNYFYQIFSSIVIGVVSFSLSLFIARQVGASQFGQYSTALAIGSILAIGLDGGMRNLLTRECSRASKQLSGIHEILPQIAMGHSLIAATIASIFCFIAFPNQLYLGLGITWCFWGAVITQYASAVLRGHGYFKTDSLWQIKQRGLTALFISATILLGYFETWHLLVAWTAGALLANLFFKEGFRFRPFFKPILPPDLKLYRILLPLLWIDLASTIYFRSDLIILRSLGVSDTDIGQYAAAYRLIEATILVASPISIIIFRKIRLLHKNPLLQKKYIAKSLLIGTLFGFFGLAFLELAAKPLVHLTYGEQYAQAGALLPILGWMIVFLIPNAILTQSALALNLEKSYALVATLAAFGNISMNYLLIPKYGTVGAAYSSIATELLLVIGLSIVIFQKLKGR